MNLADPAQHDAALADFAAAIQRFVHDEIAPNVDAWDEAGTFPRDIYRRAAQLGLLGLGYPESLGGTPASLRWRSVMVRELARAGSGGLIASLFSHNIGLPPVIAAGTAALRARVAPAVLSGEKIAALAITEPSGGSDVARLRTTARRDGDHYVVDGEKTFITSGMRADYLTVAVRTGGPGASGISLLLIDGDTPGLTRTPLKKMGWWMSDTAALHFDACRVPASQLIGEEDRGFRLIMENFNGERLLMADQACAFAEVCHDEALDWARQRHTFGEPLVNRQVIRHKLVDMRMRIASTHAWLDSLMTRMDTDPEAVRDANVVADLCMLKNHATQTLQWCADQAVQILGGMGYMRGMKSERIYREVKIMMIGGGAEEIMKDLAARQLGL